MIARILQPSASSQAVLQYNMKKFWKGTADIVEVVNLPSIAPSVASETIEQMESNPAIAAQVRKKSFHLTLGPGPTDKVTEQQCIELAKEIMEELGYGEQPIVIFRHNDIEREHFHIVSTRVNKKGELIDSHFEAKRLMKIMRELAPKYGFAVGSDDKAMEETQLPVLVSKEFSPSGMNTKYSLRALFEEALKYDFHSLYQFGCVMMSMNVNPQMRKRKDDGYNFVLQGLDDNGKPCSRKYSMEKELGYRGVENYQRRLDENNAMGILQLDRKVAIKEIADYCFENTGSAKEFCKALEEAGIRHVLQRNEKNGSIRRLTLVEKNTYALVDSAVRGELFIKPLIDAEKNGHWEPPGRKKIIPGAKVRKKDDAPFFTPQRTAELKERITRAINKYKGIQPGGAPRIGGGGPRITR